MSGNCDEVEFARFLEVNEKRISKEGEGYFCVDTKKGGKKIKKICQEYDEHVSVSRRWGHK